MNNLALRWTLVLGVGLLFPLMSASANCPNGRYQSSNYLSTLLAGNPTLQVSSENAELRLRDGAIRFAGAATLYSDGAGISFTGTGDLKARGRYRLISRRGRSFIKIDSVRADIFETVMYIGGIEAFRNDYRSLVFSDRSIRYRCQGTSLSLITEVNGAEVIFSFQMA